MNEMLSKLKDILTELVTIKDELLGLIHDLLRKLNADKTGEFSKLFKLLLRDEVVAKDQIVFSADVIFRAQINSDTKPTLPFDGARINKHIGEGRVVVEKRTDGTYVNDKKLGVRQSVRQLNGGVVDGTEICVEIERDKWAVLNATLCDFFEAHPEFVHDNLKRDKDGKTIYVYFWGTEFLCSALPYNMGVRFGNWNGDRWVSKYGWRSNNNFGYWDVALVFESEGLVPGH